ncbi:CLUMA_CG007368, isoform A [Clunio marinus]|uniref:CLUMA_CG007368, isoform A n=1 Tax=Clunio marinus TaxID=568069 RepID=A0A1J1I627_9DIPT|nr:CLUMA_CG007368, isoform A [Clunio marinus]
MMLSDKFLEKARNELREDETRKEQALEHFREWLNKHPYIKSIRQDDVFLLQFLRTKKYTMDKVFNTFENCILAQKKYSKWFDFKDSDFDRMMELYQTGYIYPLAERDEDGRRIIFIQLRRLNPDYFTSADAIRLSAVLSASLLEEEETQIAGVATIIDHEGMTMKHTSLFSVADIVDFADCLKNAVGRYKQLFLVNLPSFAVFLLDVARSTLSDKLKKRIVLPKNMDDLKNYINPSMLPKEYGGDLPEAEHMEIFNQYFRSVRPNLEEIRARVIDWTKVPNFKTSESEAVGSFRKLEID